jgi:hypothetical protein
VLNWAELGSDGLLFGRKKQATALAPLPMKTQLEILKNSFSKQNKKLKKKLKTQLRLRISKGLFGWCPNVPSQNFGSP